MPSRGTETKDGRVGQKPVRVFADGVYDMFHWGHANSLRQAKALGDILVVGVHSDADVLRHKGPPVMNEQERYAAVRACKWVDEVVEGAPYATQLSVLDEHDIDFCVHGEDITTDEHGNDAYAAVKAAGRYREIRRSRGVSTTDLVGRMLLLTRTHHERDTDKLQVAAERSSYTGVPVMPSSITLAQFASGCRQRTGDDRVVYIDGSFDLFNCAHASALCEARKLGTYVIVGLYDDQTVNRTKGLNFPIQSLQERVLSVLQCRYVDEVVTGAPWCVTESVINTLNVAIVASGTVCDYPECESEDPYAAAKKMGIFRQFQSAQPELTTRSVIDRVMAHRARYVERNRKKEKGQIRIMEDMKRERDAVVAHADHE